MKNELKEYKKKQIVKAKEYNGEPIECNTSWGKQICNDGDYLVYSNDECYPVKADVFLNTYEEVGIHDFSWSLSLLKQGRIVARKGWNGKGMYIALASKGRGKDVDVIIEPFFIIKNTHDTFNTWVPSISDLLAEDWEDVTELYSK